MYEVIGVKNAHGVILAFHFEQTVKHPVHGIAFALFGVIKTLMYLCTGFACHFGSFICAVVSNNKNIIQFVRVIQQMQVFYQSADNAFFVMRADNHGKSMLFFINLFVLFAVNQPEERKRKIINGKKYD